MGNKQLKARLNSITVILLGLSYLQFKGIVRKEYVHLAYRMTDQYSEGYQVSAGQPSGAHGVVGMEQRGVEAAEAQKMSAFELLADYLDFLEKFLLPPHVVRPDEQEVASKSKGVILDPQADAVTHNINIDVVTNLLCRSTHYHSPSKYGLHKNNAKIARCFLDTDPRSFSLEKDVERRR